MPTSPPHTPPLRFTPTNGTPKKANTAYWIPAFLKTMAQTGNVRLSCQAADIKREHVYRYRDKHPEFARKWKRAMDDALDVLEAIAVQRARTTSDTLLIFLLKSHRPEIYRETLRQEHSGPAGGPVTIRVVYEAERGNAGK